MVISVISYQLSVISHQLSVLVIYGHDSSALLRGHYLADGVAADLFPSCFFVALGVAAEGAGGSEFTEFMTDHLLGNIDGNVLFAVVNGDRVTDHIGNDCRGPGPSFNHLFTALGVEFFDFFHQVAGDKWPLFQ